MAFLLVLFVKPGGRVGWEQKSVFVCCSILASAVQLGRLMLCLEGAKHSSRSPSPKSSQLDTHWCYPCTEDFLDHRATESKCGLCFTLIQPNKDQSRMFCKNWSLISPKAQAVSVITTIHFSLPVSVLSDAIFTSVLLSDISGAVPDLYQWFGKPLVFEKS